MNADQDIAKRLIPNRVRFHLDGRSVKLDRRMNAVRGDLADFALAGVLFAPHYAKAEVMHCLGEAAFVREAGAADARAVSQLLPGEAFHLLDVTGSWAWGFCDHDDYVGYVERSALGVGALAATHHVATRSAPLFAAADIKAPVLAYLPAGSRISGTVEGDFIVTEQGAIHSRHVLPIADHEDDWVAAAERQIGQPYVWGGRGAGGIDCSGLVQLALGQAGIRVPRDSDMQRDAIGDPLPAAAPLQRGDLLFFPGHVGIMLDAVNMLHANAFWMSTMVEPLADVIARLKPAQEEPVLARKRVSL